MIRWLKKADGTKVLQESVPDVYDKWVDVPTIEEPKPKKELWEVLNEVYEKSTLVKFRSIKDDWEMVSKAAREYIENERKQDCGS